MITPKDLMKHYCLKSSHVLWVFIIISLIISVWLCILTSKEEDYASKLLTSVSIFIAILGWYASAEKDRENNNRNKRLEYLSTAYEGISLFVDRNPNSDCEEDKKAYEKYLDGFEKAVEIIQLHGNLKEIDLICDLVERANDHREGRKSIPLNKLLIILRKELRKELLLESTDRPIIHIRWTRRPQSK